MLPPPSPVEASTFAKASNAFGVDLYREVASAKGNVAISPASVSMALAMPWVGARGPTSDEMKKVLHFEDAPEAVATSAGKLSSSLQDPSRPVVFRIANQLFGEITAPIEKPFLDTTSAAYGAPLVRVDFKKDFEGARANINTWVADKTEDRIKELIPIGGLDERTRLVVVNAIYFKGDWARPFSSDATHAGAFFAPSGEKQAPMMHSGHGATYGYAEDDGVKALSMDYEGGSMSMLFLLPNEKDGVAALERSLTPAKIDGLVASLSNQPVDVTLPKFKIAPSQSLALGPTLGALGMPTAFDDRAADFTGISNPPDPDERLHIQKVFHKAFLAVDEKGTEAAAATGVAVGAVTSLPPPAVPFVADHPFVFMIRDNASGLVLFMGRLEDPTQND